MLPYMQVLWTISEESLYWSKVTFIHDSQQSNKGTTNWFRGGDFFGSKYLFSFYSRLNHLFLYRPNQIIVLHFFCILKSESELILGSNILLLHLQDQNNTVIGQNIYSKNLSSPPPPSLSITSNATCRSTVHRKQWHDIDNEEQSDDVYCDVPFS